MMSDEVGDLQPVMGAVTPEKRKGKRYSTGQTHSSGDRNKSVEPHYLRASTGSCHDLCKYGRRHETEIKPWSSGLKRRIDKLPPEKIVATDEVLSKGKNYLKARPESSSFSKGHLPDSSSATKQIISSSEKRTMGSNNVSKSQESSQLKSSATPGRLSHPVRTVKERVLLDFEVSNLVSVKDSERRISGKSATPSRTKNAIAGLTSFSKSLASSRVRSKDRKAAENTGICNQIRVKNAAIASTSSVPTKSSAGSARTSVKRKLWKPKTVIGQSDQKIAKDHGIRRIEKEVPPEKTLYVIDMESNDEVKNFDVSEINVVNELPESENNGIIIECPPSLSPSPSPSVTESMSQQNSSTMSSHEEVKEGMENSCTQFSHHEEKDEEGDYADDEDEDEDEEEVSSDYSDGESEIFSDSESGETQNKEGESMSTADSGIRRRPREAVRVHPEGVDGQPAKLKFRRGRVVEIQFNKDTPRRLKFRRHKTLEEDECRTHRSQRRVPTKREVAADPDYVADPNSEKYTLRRSHVHEKKDGQGGLFNNVIEETASKLVEARKSKVKALVGAFETVISLQDGKPSAINTG